MSIIFKYLKDEKAGSVVLFIVMLLSLAFAWILELFFNMQPCSLCLLQRFGMYIACLFLGIKLILDYFVASINNIWVRKSLLSLSLIGLVGSLISGLRQTYIQLLPEDKLPSCGADLETLLTIVGPFEAIVKVFQGSGECADKALVVLGLSLANWATILFAVLIVFNTSLLLSKNYKK